MTELTQEQIRERTRWARKLLSGEYNQQTGALAVRCPDGETGYCCLGVYEHMCDPESSRLRFPDTPFRRRDDNCSESMEGTLDSDALARLGFSETDHETAYELNDTNEWSFAEIARGLAWTTSNGRPFYELLCTLEQNEWGEDEFEPHDPTVVPDDFDVEAWLAEVES